jgi:hypothetical protein
MKRATWLLLTVGIALLLMTGDSEIQGQRRGGGGGFRGAGGAGSAAGGHFGGAGVSRTTTSGPVIGPGGGTWQGGSKSGSATTKGGSTINYGGAGVGGATGGGVTAGRGIGGVQVTTPGGNTYKKVGTAGGAVGPGGVAAGGAKSVGVGTGPGGSAVTGSRSGAVSGPGGAAGYRGGVVIGPSGAAGYRGAAAIGPNGAVAGRTAVAGRYGTYHVSRTVLTTQGAATRAYWRTYPTTLPIYRANWYANYPGAWFAAGWAANRMWTAATWGSLAAVCSYPAQPVYYDYGETVVYNDNRVYINGDEVASGEQYAQQATQIADAGRDAKVSDKEAWEPLGVFAMVQEGEKTSYKIFQLAVNKDGVIRGNYYDALADTNTPVYGAVDRKTQRAAWSIGTKKTVVFEAGIANLTRDETPMLVHMGPDNAQQFILVRLEPPPEGTK